VARDHGRRESASALGSRPKCRVRVSTVSGWDNVRRLADIIRLYQLLAALEDKLAGKRTLAGSSGRMEWPRRGVYFFFEAGEVRSDSGAGPRIVSIGTHATTTGAGTRLWGLLSQHRGTVSNGGGNHRASIMRLLVGIALKKRGGLLHADSWGVGRNPGKACAKFGISKSELSRSEHALEAAVSENIRAMPFLWVDVDDVPGPGSDRGLIERNSIALLSNYWYSSIDPASSNWLGRFCDRERVQQSGLWNNNHVDEEYDPRFLTVLEGYVMRANREPHYHLALGEPRH
jgi:hypothetical protein